MKLILSFFALLASGQLLFAQNTYPWPSTGFVGIGTTTPTSPLHIVSTTSNLAQFKTSVTDNTAISILNGSGEVNLGIGANASTIAGYAWSNTGNFMIGNDGGPTLFVKGMGNGFVGINTVTPHYPLDVNGIIRANEVVVNAPGADYVFDTAYHLPSLHTVDAYIHAHHHLPDIAPAAQMQDQGMPVGENQTQLLKKIEELTLYIIEQDKKMAKMQSEIDALKADH